MSRCHRPNPADRVSPAEALDLLTRAETADLMARAHRARLARHGTAVYHVHSLNLNPTNRCVNRCALCAFWRADDAEDAYHLTLPEVRQRLQAARGWSLTDLHIVGGLNDQISLAYLSEILRMARRLLPGTSIQAFTAVEIDWLARRERRTVEQILSVLQAAGLEALPGGGAEVFSPRVRSVICPEKIDAQRWLDIHATAHRLGLATNATLLFGHIETAEEIVDHWVRLRDQQDRTGGFQAFCPLPFHPRGTRIDVSHGPTGNEIVRLVAVARLFLDNIPHIRVLANYLDRKLLQTLLFSGADDVGGTSIDERIAKAAGARDDHAFTGVRQIQDFISALGLTPVLTNSLYRGIPHPQPVRIDADRWREPLERAAAGERLNGEDALTLLERAPFQDLALAAHRRRCQTVGADACTYVVDRNISFTNVCVVGCRFCAYCRKPHDPDAFTLDHDTLVDQAREAAALGATQIMLQGGLNPALNVTWYETLLRRIKRAAPDLWLHSLSPAEILWLGRRAGLTVRQTLERLHAAGLDSLPGGGAEILVDAVRRRVSPAKLSADEWFEVMRTAQQLGLSTTATMVYGLGETAAQRVEHLLRIRRLQDETGGFRAFICWSFQPDRTGLDLPRCSGPDYLRMVALSRLVLDNIPHLQAGWVTEGPDLAQLALLGGADDFGGVLMEEKVVKATGIDHGMTVAQLRHLVRAAGLRPLRRNTLYEILDRESTGPRVRAAEAAS